MANLFKYWSLLVLIMLNQSETGWQYNYCNFLEKNFEKKKQCNALSGLQFAKW